MAKYTTRNTQFAFVAGTPQAESPYILAAEVVGLFSPEARKGHLYIVTETSQDLAGRDACQMVIRTIRKAFYADTSFSATSALRKAILAANTTLYQQNFSTPPSQRTLVGLTCVVLKDTDLYIARVAPAQLWLCANGRSRAIPPQNTSLAAATVSLNTPTSRALGSSLTTEPEFYRAVVGAGDTFLIGSSNLEPYLTPTLLNELLCDPADLAVMKDSLQMITADAGLTDAHGLLVQLRVPIREAADQTPIHETGLGARGRMLMQSIETQVARLRDEVTLLVRGSGERQRRRRTDTRITRRDGEQEQLQNMPDLPTHSPDPPSLPRQIDLGESLDQRVVQMQAVRRRNQPRRQERNQPLPPSAFLGESPSTPPASQRREPYDEPDLAGTAYNSPYRRRTTPNPFGDRPRGLLAKLQRYISDRTRQRRLQRPPARAMAQQARQPGLSYRRERPQFPWLRILALLSLVLILVLYGITLSSQNQVREADDGMSRAEQSVAAIYAAPDETTAEQRLTEAGEVIAALRATGSVTTTVQSRQRFDALEREYTQALNAIRKISYFETIEEVAVNPQPEARFDSVIVPPAPVGITNTVAFGSIYLLDANTGVLYRKPKSGGTIEPILRPTDQIGPLSVGRVLGATWRFDTIVAVSQSSDGGPYNFYFRNGNVWSYSILAGSEVWGKPAEHFRIANYQGNLYIWGADPTNILRYRSGFYGEFPDPWILDADGKQYENSLDMTIDGQVYMLQPDGRVLVFVSNDLGERKFDREIVPSGIEPPIKTIARFSVTGEPGEGSIFLVDSFYSRIIQLDKQTGKFIQQIKASPDSDIQLEELANLGVDSSTARPFLYMVNGDQVVRAPLPDPPPPFRDGTPGPTPALTPASTAP